uniref:mavicyanin-like n=1 Tax=Erigeron canadensis TaxID=72917 RepID=UPI001CB90855|nr:mavicyanin-like [Erigeron canadensis]
MTMWKVRMMSRLLLIMIIKGVLMKVVMGTVYTVGDSQGWAILVNSDYTTWTSSKRFRVGDTLLFHYHPGSHNVIQVNRYNYRSCNTSAPWKTFGTGNDSFNIKAPGHYYFSCSFPGHCEAGQKLNVRVLKKYSLITSEHKNVSSTTSTDLPKTDAMAPTSVAQFVTGYNFFLGVLVVMSTLYLCSNMGCLII